MTITTIHCSAPTFAATHRTLGDRAAALRTLIRRAVVRLGRDHTVTPTPSEQALSAIDHVHDMHR